ncbi:transcription initiation factor IID, 18kD subunit-domain-containing protein [Haematococcus lacustris]
MSEPGGRKKKVATVAVAGKSTGPKASSASGAATAARPAPPGSTGKDNKEGIGLGRGLMGQEARARLTKRARVAVGAGPARAAAAASHADLFAAPKAQATGAAIEPDSFKGQFTKELRSMVYGFGDDESPLQETVDLVEEVLMHFLRDIMQRAVIAAADSLRAKPDERDILFVVRKDPVKFARIKELLRMQQLVKQTCNTNDPVAHAAATAAEEEELAAAKAEDAD